MNSNYDITFIGHMCFDEIIPFEGPIRVAPGSAVLCGAMAAARAGKKVAVFTKMARMDENILKPMRDIGIDVFVIPAVETTYSKVVHPVADDDVRELSLVRSAGFFTIDEIPPIGARCLHLAGISDQEFSIDLIIGLKRKGFNLSVDMQSFVRQVNIDTREVIFKDTPYKRDIARIMNKIKLDIVEAAILTGTDDLEKSAIMFEEWGCPEVVITKSEGVLARANNRTYYEKFSNTSSIGRTGRGDTTFAAYLSYRLDHDVEESIKFAAALVSIKMETPGPFCGTLEDILARLKEKHSI